MKQETRDNLIYLAVGLGIVGLIVADLVYTNGHGQEMWWPSRFAFRRVYTTTLLVYFISKGARKLRATLIRVLGCVVFACVAHLAMIFAFRQVIGQLSGIVFAALAVFEMFLVFQLAMALVRFLRPE